jgi:hypothetical protein
MPQEQEYLEEYHVLDRVGYTNDEKTVQEIAAEAGIIIQQRPGHLIRDATQRFYVYTNASARRMISDGIINWVSHNEVTKILSSIKFIKNPEYKNADAFILGYAVTRPNGKEININRLNSLKPILEQMDPVIKQTDVIRYANLWINHQYNQ